MATISVIIPSHNRATLLIRALHSVFAQTHQATEVIVIDDGSDDDSAERVHRLFPQAIYHYQPQQGVSAARNAGIRLSRGEWIAFLDSDDEWLPDKLERQLAAIRHDQQARICHTDEIWIRDGRRVNPMKKHGKLGGMIFEQCLPLCRISPSSVMIHRSVFDQVGLFDETLSACEDYDLWLRICARYPVHYIEQPLITKYGGHADQLSRRFWGMDRFRIRALEKIIASGVLSPLQHDAAIDMLLEKAEIYLNGARKRQKHTDIAKYSALINRYRPLLPQTRQVRQ